MKINHREPAYTDKAAPFIEEFGGKLGGLEFLRAYAPGLHERIVETVFFKPGQDVNLDRVSQFDEDGVIVRGSHKNDFQGLVDILETEVVPVFKVDAAVERVRNSGNLPEVMEFAKHENPDYDGKVVVGVQRYHGNQYFNGSITAHPNNEGKFQIDTEMCDDQGKPGVRKLIEIYREIERAGLVKDDYAFQVEYACLGKENIRINQVRAFMRKEKGGEFEIEGGSPAWVFGVTPPEGIETDVYCSPDGLDKDGRQFQVDGSWSLLKTRHNDKPPLGFQPDSNLAAYLISQSFGSGITTTLEHNHFRLAQKADVTIFENAIFDRYNPHRFNQLLIASGAFDSELPHQSVKELMRYLTGKLNVRVRITSNGLAVKVEAV